MGGVANFIIDFGSAGTKVDDLLVTVPGLSGIAAGSDVEPWFQGTDQTSDNDREAHHLVQFFVRMSCSSINPGANECQIRATADGLVYDKFKGRLVWN